MLYQNDPVNTPPIPVHLHPPAPVVEPPKKKRRIWLWALGGLLLLGALVAIFLYMYPGAIIKHVILKSLDSPEMLSAELKSRTPKIYTPSGNDASYLTNAMTINLSWKKTEFTGDESNSRIKFENGKSLIVGNKNEVNALKSLTQSNDTKDTNLVINQMSAKGLSTEYDFTKEMWGMQVDDIGYFDSRLEASYKSILLNLKSVLVTNQHLYSYEIKDLGVLQAGDPEIDAKSILVYIFDDVGDQYTIVFSDFSQNEIDYTISNLRIGSFKPLDPETPKPEQSLTNEAIKARDEVRLENVRKIMMALELFYNDNGGYPAGTNGKVSDTAQATFQGTVWSTYLPEWPEPTLPADGTCTDDQNKYIYTPTKTMSNGVYPDYLLTFCFGGSVTGREPGVHSSSSLGIQ